MQDELDGAKESYQTENSLKILLKGAGFTFAGLIFSKAAFYVFRLLVARVGANEYGTFSIALTLFNIITMLGFLGVTTALLRFVPEYVAKKQTSMALGTIYSSLRIALIASLSLAFLMFITSNWLANNLFHAPSLLPVISILAIAVPFYCIGGVLLTTARAYGKMNYEILTKMFGESLIKLGLTIAFIFMGFGLFGISIAFLLSIISSFVLAIYFVEFKVVSLFRKKNAAPHLEKELLNFSLPIMLSGIIYLFIAWSDVLILGFYRGVTEVGSYNSALPTAALLITFPMALNSLFLPVMVPLLSKNLRKTASEVYSSMTKWVFLFSLPICLMFVLFSRQVLRVIWGGEYEVAAFSLQILAIGHLVYSLFYSSPDLLSALNKPKLVLQSMLISAIANVGLNLLLVPRMGMEGSAISTSIALSLYGIICSYHVWKNSGLQPLNAFYGKILLSAIVGIWLAYFAFKELTIPSTHLFLVITGVLYLAAYFMMLLALKVFDRFDLRMIESIEGKTKINLEPIKRIIRKYYSFK